MKNCYTKALLLVGFLIATAINGYPVTFNDGGTNINVQHYLTVPSATRIDSSVYATDSEAHAMVVIQPYGTVLSISAAPHASATQTLTNQPVGYQYIVIHGGSGSMITTISW